MYGIIVKKQTNRFLISANGTFKKLGLVIFRLQIGA